MYPQANILRRRPRRTLDHLFGDEEEIVLPDGVRPRRALPLPTVPVGSFAGDAPVPVVRALPPVRPVLEPQPQLVSDTLENIGEPPVRPPLDPNAPLGSSGEPFGSTRPRRTQPRDYLADDAQYLRDLQTNPVERSRLKSFGAGLGRGGILGGLFGLARPEMYGEMKRNREIKRVEDRITGDLELRKAQREIRREPLQERLLESQVAENEAQAEARSRPPRPKLVGHVQPDGTTILVPEEEGVITGRPKPETPMVEMTLSDGRKVMVPPSSALGADATRTSRVERAETKTDERESQRLAAQDEFEQLTADEAAAGDEKNRAYAYLESLKANPNVSEDDLREATKAAEAANVFYRSFGPKKAAAKARITRYSGSSRAARPSRPAQKTLPPELENRIRAEAVQRGLDPNVAVERARARQ